MTATHVSEGIVFECYTEVANKQFCYKRVISALTSNKFFFLQKEKLILIETVATGYLRKSAKTRGF
jgi:hypothetical protein